MKTIHRSFYLQIILGLILFGPACKRVAPDKGDLAYEPNWESLSKHEESPEWFTDAKFGIYFHWGVYSVPAFYNEWYPRWMHFKGHKVYDHHVANYGHPSEFGYHDFVPMFTAEKFDPSDWASLFKQAGARFAGPVAEHHDGFSMWDSDITPWNAADKGPEKDITGLLKSAIEKADMKFITTFHHARNLQRYKGKEEEQMKQESQRLQFRHSHYPFFAGMPPTTEDEELKYLYGNIPEAQWLEDIWFGKLKEVIENYDPDIIWFDSWLDQIPEEYLQKFCAYYLNHANSQGKEVVIVRKQDDLPLEVSVDDLEKSRKNYIGEKVWMTDETLSKGSWCYTEGLEIKPAADVLHVLIDIVSKNGVLLLNISPKADGTIPQNQKEVLLAMGQWLDKYGESIYETRPWYTYGEGPVKEPEGHFSNNKEFLKIKYSAKDIRYTRNGDVLYATFMGTPDQGSRILLESFAEHSIGKKLKIERVQLLQNGTELNWELLENGLEVQIPDNIEEEMAVVMKVELQE